MKDRRDFLTGVGTGLAGAGAVALTWQRYGPYRLPPHARLCYAQHAEDQIAWGMFQDYLKIPQPSYLDIGACHPVEANNTYLFYTHGCRGVLVEPNVDLIAALRSERPGDTVLNVGIGVTTESEADYYVLNEPAWNTFSKEEADLFARNTGGQVFVKAVVKMPLVNINEAIAKYFPQGKPNFISFDAEGLNLAILKTLDFSRFRSEVICVETIEANSNKYLPEIGQFLAEHGYVMRGATIINSLFVDRKSLER